MILLASPNTELIENWKSHLIGFEVSKSIAHDKRQLHTLLTKNNMHVLLLDVKLLGNEGIDGIAGIHEMSKTTNIIVATDNFDEREELFAIIFGARAYISQQIKPDLLARVIRRVQEGEVWVDRQFVGRLIDELESITKERQQEALEIEKGILTMTPREGEIAELIATGASNRRIAEKLSISERTVKAHLGVIFKKIGITDRLQLALYMNKYHQLSSLWRTRGPSP